MIDEPAPPFAPASGVTLEPGQHPPAPAKLPPPVVSITLIAVNTIVFVITVALGASLLLPDPEKMADLGGNFAPLTLEGEPWRLLSAMFLHYGVLHLAMNMLGLWSGGLLAERMYGRAGFTALYLIAGLAGGLATVSHKIDVVSAGASGAIFGVFGAVGAYLLAHRDRIDQDALKKESKGLLVFMGYNLIYGFSQPSIDMSAHLGGLAGGFVVGLALTYGSRARTSLARVALVTALGLGAVGAAVATMPMPAAPPPNELQKAYGAFDEVHAASIAAYNGLVREAQAGTLSDAAFADRLEQEILPGWRSLELRISAQEDVPPKLRQVHAKMLDYIVARRVAWTAFVDRLREKTTDDELFGKLNQAAAQRLAELNAALEALKK